MAKAKLPKREFKWTPKLAYVIGLLATDGSLSNDGRHIIMRSTDYQLLETFRDCLGIKNKIGSTPNKDTHYTRKNAYRVQFGNIQLYRWLVSIGITPAKTHTIGKIRIPNKYFRDFLRGHLDGDGTIFTYQDTYNVYKEKRYINTRVYTKLISVSEKYIRWLHHMIKINSPVRGVLLHGRRRLGRAMMWEIKFSKYESLELFEWLYYKSDLPTLARKRKLADYLLSNTKQGKLIRVPKPLAVT